jgi:hypothetical protein
MKTQKQRVLALLKNWTSAIQALQKCGTMRLASYVHMLKSEGYDIEDYTPAGKTWKVYRLKK